jgi:hypothetical protein
MIDLQRIFHTGIIVHDLEKAKREIGESMNLTWTPVRRFVPLVFLDTPARWKKLPWRQCIRAKDHIIWKSSRAQKAGSMIPTWPDARHIGVWVDDLSLEVDRLVGLGWKVQAAGGRLRCDLLPFAAYVCLRRRVGVDNAQACDR